MSHAYNVMARLVDRRDALAHMAARVEGDEFFLGHPLALYRDRRGWTDDDTAAWLGTDAAGLTRLKLCRAITADCDALRQVAAGCGCDAGRLGEILGDGD